MTALLVLFAFVVLLLVFANTKADAFRIERRAVMAAPAEKIFAQLNDFHAWTAWSPWEKIDPSMQRSYSGAAQGVGAVYSWEGNKKVGSGRMAISDASPCTRLLIKLDFFAPWKANNTTEFTLSERDGVTTVNWAMFGPQPYMAKVMSLFFNMDKLVGKDFETGLANLKACVE